MKRSTVDRADAQWIHGRGTDPRADRLREKSVVLLGCGSVGAPVAISLAQAGVGRMRLVDFDTLKWTNVGRHPLGASCVGACKSKALAARLRSEYPQMHVEHNEVDVDTIVRMHDGYLEQADIIVSAMGSWAADGRLDAWSESVGRRVPIVYGWTEAHACAGHAVLLGSDGGCLRCGFGKTGVPDFAVTAWPRGSTELSEPACGAMYQPYGPIELGFVNSLVAELALDAVLKVATGSEHRIWAGPERRLVSLGGTWTEAWRKHPSFRNDGGTTARRPWPPARCDRCRKALAA